MAEATFGGGNEFFQAWGDTDVKEATRLIEICLEAGVNFFDTAGITHRADRRVLVSLDRGIFPARACC